MVGILLSHLADAGKKKDLLRQYGWYRNMNGGWTHAHCMDHMTAAEVVTLSPGQLEYKLKHGSAAKLPDNI